MLAQVLHRGIVRFVVLVGAAVAGLIGLQTAPLAWAHTSLVTSDPEAGATVEVPPGEITLTFGENPIRSGTKVLVLDPDGQPVQDGNPEIDGDSVVQALNAGLPAGRYTVEYRVTSEDGHPITGSLTFTAKAGATTPTDQNSAAPAADAAATPAQTKPEGVTTRGWIVVGSIVGFVIIFRVLWSRHGPKRTIMKGPWD